MAKRVAIETVDNGFIVRTGGDVGRMARAFNSTEEALLFVRWVLEEAPHATADGHPSTTFPIHARGENLESALVMKEEAKSQVRRWRKTTRQETAKQPGYVPTDAFNFVTPPPSDEATTRKMSKLGELTPPVMPTDETRLADGPIKPDPSPLTDPFENPIVE